MRMIRRKRTGPNTSGFRLPASRKAPPPEARRHFVGDPNAGVVYVTEGLLKADIAHYLMNRSFAATAGVNNMAQLEFLLKELAENGTHTIIESEDMDKYRNEAACKGALKLHELARKYGMVCRGLNWNPNYKGVDDWQLALKRNAYAKRVAGRISGKDLCTVFVTLK